MVGRGLLTPPPATEPYVKVLSPLHQGDRGYTYMDTQL